MGCLAQWETFRAAAFTPIKSSTNKDLTTQLSSSGGGNGRTVVFDLLLNKEVQFLLR